MEGIDEMKRRREEGRDYAPMLQAWVAEYFTEVVSILCRMEGIGMDDH